VSDSDGAISPTVERIKQALGVDSLRKVADVLGLPYSTVKGWNARDSVQLEHLRAVKQLSGSPIDWLVDGDTEKSVDQTLKTDDRTISSGSDAAPFVAERPATYETGFNERLSTAINFVEAGLAATGVDRERVPRHLMMDAVFNLLPWPIPRKPNNHGP